MADQNKAMTAAKTEDEKDNIVGSVFWISVSWLPIAHYWIWQYLLLINFINLIISHHLQKTQKQNATAGLRSCNNILAMAQVNTFPVFLRTCFFSVF